MPKIVELVSKIDAGLQENHHRSGDASDGRRILTHSISDSEEFNHLGLFVNFCGFCHNRPIGKSGFARRRVARTVDHSKILSSRQEGGRAWH
jgi:hypothetical protein